MVACVIEIVRKCRIINYNNKKYNIKLSNFKIINKIKANENQCGNVDKIKFLSGTLL